MPRPRFAALAFGLILLGCDKPEDTPSREEVRMTCEAKTSREACEAVPSVDIDVGETVWCGWVTEVPVALEGDACSFGEPSSSCQLVSATDGCYAPTENTCGPGELQWTRSEAGTLYFGFGDGLCYPRGDLCNANLEGVVEGAPECACSCQGVPGE